MNKKFTLLFIVIFLYPSILYANDIEDRLYNIEQQINEQQKLIKDIYKLLQNKNSLPKPTSALENQYSQERCEYLQSIPPSGKRFRAWYAHIFALDDGFDLSGSRIPKSRVGSFVAEHSSEYNIADVKKYIKSDFRGKSLWQGVGYLQVLENGSYSFNINLKSENMIGSIYIGGKEIAKGYSGYDWRGSTVVGYAELDKGIYKIDFRVAADVKEDLTVDTTRSLRSNFSVSITPPNADTPLPAHKVLFIVNQ